MVQLNVIGGFLGAGKTSTVRHLVRHAPTSERIAVVVNDFGEARIDEILLGARTTVREIVGSCVCCTAPEGFVAAVGELVSSGVDRILVEPTGLARPSDLIDALRRAPYADQLELGPLVVVVDPHLLAAGKLSHEVTEQAALADVLVANRIDLATAEDRAAFRAWVASAWPGPLVVRETSFGAVPLSILRWPEGHTVSRVIDREHHDHDDHGDHEFLVRSFVWPAETVLSRRQLLQLAETPRLLRLKGLLRTDEGPLELQLAGGRVHEGSSQWRRDSRLDLVVGPADAEVLDAVERGLERAVLDPTQLAARGDLLEVAGKWFDRAALAALPGGVDDVGDHVPGRAGAAAKLSVVLAAAGVDPSASVVVVARDGFTTPPTSLTALDGAWIVHTVGDAALSPGQGGPFRLLGGPDACANVKGMVRLSVR